MTRSRFCCLVLPLAAISLSGCTKFSTNSATGAANLSQDAGTAGAQVVSPTPSLTPVPSPTSTPAASPSATPSPSASPTPAVMPTPTPTATPKATASPTPSPTATPSPTPNTATSSQLQIQFEKNYFDAEASKNDFSVITKSGGVLNLGRTTVNSSQPLSLRMRVMNTSSQTASVTATETPSGVSVTTPASVGANSMTEFTVSVSNASAASINGNYTLKITAGGATLTQTIVLKAEVNQ